MASESDNIISNDTYSSTYNSYWDDIDNYTNNSSFNENIYDWNIYNTFSDKLNNTTTTTPPTPITTNNNKRNKAKIFRKMKKTNKIYRRTLENYEMEIEDVRSKLSAVSKLLKQKEEDLIEKEEDLIEKEHKIKILESKNSVYLNCINEWENWYDEVLEN